MAEIDFILCPDCGKEIPLSEALTHQLKEQLDSEVTKKIKQIDEEKKKLQLQLASKEKEIEGKLKQKEEELTEKARQYLLEQSKKQKEELEKQAKVEFAVELEDLKKQNEENQNKIKEAQKLEIELRAERRKVEEEKKNIELEMMRRMDIEREQLQKSMQEKFLEEFKIKTAEYEKKMADMQKAVEDAQRKGSATSERFRGEILELSIEQDLRNLFPSDEIQEVPKGINGADIVQNVKDNQGRVAGIILWEIKRTKIFNQEWISKLKEDVIRAKANIPIIVTQTLPEEIKSFGEINGVWICDFMSYQQLVFVLRKQLFEVKRVEKLYQGKDQKASQIYDYLASDQFKNKIISIVESFKSMQEQLDKEKRAFTKIWAEREMQIKKMTEGTITIIGDMQGIMGGSLPKIEGIDLLEE